RSGSPPVLRGARPAVPRAVGEGRSGGGGGVTAAEGRRGRVLVVPLPGQTTRPRPVLRPLRGRDDAQRPARGPLRRPLGAPDEGSGVVHGCLRRRGLCPS